MTIKSGGKLLMATGWKVGWAIAPPKIARLLGIVSNAMNYCTNNPAQIAMAKAMDLCRTPNLEKPGQLSFLDQTV